MLEISVTMDWPVRYMTPLEFDIKSRLGLMKNAIVEKRFHWRFWHKIYCGSTLLRFGTYYAVCLPKEPDNA